MIVQFNYDGQAQYYSPRRNGKHYLATRLVKDSPEWQQHLLSYFGPDPIRSHVYNLMVAGDIFRTFYPVTEEYDEDEDYYMYLSSSMVTIISEEPYGQPVLLTHPLQLPGFTFQDLGSTVHAISFNEEYNDQYLLITEGKWAGETIQRRHTVPAGDSWENRWQEVVVKVVHPRHTFNSNTKNAFFLAIHKQGSDEFYFQAPTLFGERIDARDIEVQQGELALLRKRCFYPTVFHASEQAVQALEKSQGPANSVRWLLSNAARPDVFSVAPNYPNYLAVDATDYTKFTALDSGKVEAVLAKGEDPWTSSSRYALTPAKMLARFFYKDVFRNATYENAHNELVGRMKMLFGPEELRPELLIVRGEDVRRYYLGSNYASASGSLGQSCMRHVQCQSYLGLYVENPEQVGLAICRDRETGKIYSRALVWTNGEQRYVDRRYGSDQTEEQKLLGWCQDQGYVDIWAGGRDHYPGEVTIALPNPYQERYPYMDSMCNLFPHEGTISNKADRNKLFAHMRSTSGERPATTGEQHCQGSKRLAPRKLMVKTASSRYALPAYTRELLTGEREVEGECTLDELQHGYITKTEAIRVQVGNAVKTTHKGSNAVCLVKDAGSYRSKEDTVFSALDGGFILREYAVQMPDGKWCSTGKQVQYLALLKKRRGNQAKRVPQAHAVACAQ